MPKLEEHQRKRLEQAIDRAGEARIARLAGLRQGQISKLVNAKQEALRTPVALEALIRTVDDILSGRVPTGADVELADDDHGGGDPANLNKSDRKVRTETVQAPVAIRKDYPPSYSEDFSRAENLWLSGFNLRRIVHGHMKDLHRVLERGGSARIILLDPDYAACRDAAIQDWGTGDAASVQDYRKTIRHAHRRFCQLGTPANRNRLWIRKIKYALAFGIDAMSFGREEDGVVYVRFYPMFSGEEDRPILVLRPADIYWYTFFKDQFRYQWERAVPWGSDDVKPTNKNKSRLT